MKDTRHLQLEYLPPKEIEAAMSKRPLIYIPLGTIEWHCYHLPVGFDAFSAHFLSLRAAACTGGLVMPPFYIGTGGGHGHFPWTIMAKSEDLKPMFETVLKRLPDFGVKQAVLVSGHFPDAQVEFVQTLSKTCSTKDFRIDVAAPSLANDILAQKGDHAARFETGLMLGLAPEHVYLDRLPDLDTHPDNLETRMTDPSHPLYGIYGPDPREMPETLPDTLVTQMVDWIVQRVDSPAD